MDDCRSGTAMALLAALGVGFGAAQVTAQQAGCDVDSNGYVSADEAAACAERDYSTMTGGQEAITRERFEQAFPASENVDEMWAEADTNQDGQLSQAEWSDWSARRFRSASTRVEGLSVDDYEALEAQYHMGDDQQGRDESVGAGDPGTVGGEAGGTIEADEGSGESGGASSGSGSEGGDAGDDGSDGEAGAGGDSDRDRSDGDDGDGSDGDGGSDRGGSGGGSGG